MRCGAMRGGAVLCDVVRGLEVKRAVRGAPVGWRGGVAAGANLMEHFPLAPIAQGIEHCPPEAGAQVRILLGAPSFPVFSGRIGPSPRLSVCAVSVRRRALPVLRRRCRCVVPAPAPVTVAEPAAGTPTTLRPVPAIAPTVPEPVEGCTLNQDAATRTVPELVEGTSGGAHNSQFQGHFSTSRKFFVEETFYLLECVL
jgi:hypothetical protein